jgi:hypothetical protein
MIVCKETLHVSSEDLEKNKYFESGGVSDHGSDVSVDSKYKGPKEPVMSKTDKFQLENYLKG